MNNAGPSKMKFRIEIHGRLGRRDQRLLRLIQQAGDPQVFVIIAWLDPATAGGLARAYGVKVKKIEE